VKLHCISELTIGETTTVLGEIELRVRVITRGTGEERPARLDEVSMEDLEKLMRWLRRKLNDAKDAQQFQRKQLQAADGEGQP
jgi:hypothetical protein